MLNSNFQGRNDSNLVLSIVIKEAVNPKYLLFVFCFVCFKLGDVLDDFSTWYR